MTKRNRCHHISLLLCFFPPVFFSSRLFYMNLKKCEWHSPNKSSMKSNRILNKKKKTFAMNEFVFFPLSTSSVVIHFIAQLNKNNKWTWMKRRRKNEINVRINLFPMLRFYSLMCEHKPHSSETIFRMGNNGSTAQQLEKVQAC